MDKDYGLDKASRKRLEKLNPSWNDSVDSCSLEKLTLPDLRLLLAQYTPLQELIREIAGAPKNEDSSELTYEKKALPPQSEDTMCNPAAVHTEIGQTSAELSKALQTIKDLEQARANLEKQLHQLQQQLNETQSELVQSALVPNELRLLRQDGELAQRLGLGNLPTDDTAALIKVVAVLSQRDNLERLWILLKDRCESSSRMATNDEVCLLKAALSWHNHNWQSRPYQPINPTVGSNYDYERQLRSRDSSAGESVAELRLFGIADSSNKPLCKALVTTR